MIFVDSTKDEKFINYVDQDKTRYDPNGLRFSSLFSDWIRSATDPNVADAVNYGSYNAYKRLDSACDEHEQQAFAELL